MCKKPRALYIPFLRHRLKLRLVLRVRLDPQRGREHELADCGAEAGEEGVEGLLRGKEMGVSFVVGDDGGLSRGGGVE